MPWRRCTAVVVVALCCACELVVCRGVDRNVDDEVLPADNEFEWKFFPPLWSRPLLADVITSPLEGDAAPSLAHAYTCDMFGEGDGCQVPEGSARLAYGGVLLQRVARSDNATSVQRAAEWAVARGAEVVAGNLRLQDEERVDNRVTVEVEEWTVQEAWSMELAFTKDGVQQMEFGVVAERVRGKRQMILHPVTVGVNYMLELRATLLVRHNAGTQSDATEAEETEGAVVETMVVDFAFVVSYDVDHVYNLFRCTWREAESSRPTAEPEAGGEVEVSPEGDVTSSSDDSSHSGGAKVVPPFHGKFLCYNVWNSNPPRWLWPNPRRRWDLYRSRMDHLTGIVKSEDPDVIGFQEVRYDSTLAYPTQHAQIEHLAERLPGYQYVYQSANLYYDQANFPGRDEEGPAIFSKHPIVNSSYLLLDRDVDDSDDGHHRLFPGGSVVDVYVVHMSLSEPARNRAVASIWKFMQATSSGIAHMLMGDLNAEPDTVAIQFLMGLTPLPRAAVSSGGDASTSVDPIPPARLRDAWSQLHEEPEPRSTDEAVRYSALTFPSDEPKKRIDMILCGTTQESEQVSPKVVAVYLVGQDPVEGTEEHANTGIGMVHALSPVYASDHRGVVAVFEFDG